MQIYYHKNFLKHYRKRIKLYPKLELRFRKRLELFIKDPQHSLLRDHSLSGEKAEFRAFWVTGDTRVVYQKQNGQLYLYDIGTHNQVY